jgi:hypothetical protein
MDLGNDQELHETQGDGVLEARDEDTAKDHVNVILVHDRKLSGAEGMIILIECKLYNQEWDKDEVDEID